MSSGSIRIIQLPEKSSVNTDDYMAVDSSANGTKKVKFTDLLDNNLSAQNKAADAQATGEAINDISARVDNMINTQTNAEVTTLWTGQINLKNETANLSESINNFDFIDVYCGGTDTVFARQHVSGNSVHFELQAQNMSDDASVQFMRWWETGLTISGTTATITKAIKCFWDDFSQHPVVSQATGGGVDIVRIDGVKIGHADNDEIVDARVGANGATYPTLGDAIRGQVTDLKSEINDIAVNGEYVILNNANILPDPQMNKGLWGQTQGSMTVTTKSGSLSNVINYTRTGSSSGTLGIVVPISLLEDGKTYRFHIRSEDAHTFPIRIRDNNNGTYGNVNKYLVSDQSMTHTDGNKYHYYDWTFDASELTSGYQYVQIDLKLTAESSTTYHFYEPFLGLANGDLAYEKTYYIDKYEILEPTNLFNGNYYANSYWDSNGVLTSANKYCCAKPQLLGAGNYIFIVCKQYYGSGAGTVYVFSSASSTTMTEKFSATLLEERTVNGLTCALYTFSLSEDKYVATNIGYQGFEADDYMIVRGSTVADYPASYRYYFEPYSVVKEPTKLNESMVEQTNPIYGKKVAVNGDSICAGAGANGGFIKPIAGRNNMDSTNIGVSGGTIAYGTTYDGGANRHWICTTIQNMPSGCDYYIFEGGVNDYANNVPVGSLTTGFPVKGAVDDNIDNTTITGAMEYACRDLVTLFAGKKCGFVFVHGIYGLTGSYANWHTQFKPAMISALKKWGVPYIDLEEEVPPLNLIASLKSVYTSNGDGWHPNEAGYEAFYTDKIEAWMKTL